MNRKQFVKILCYLRGFQTAIKNVHWNQDHKANKHKILDDVYTMLDEFMDGFAEDGITIFGEIELNEIREISIEYIDGEDLMVSLDRFIKKIKKLVLNSDEIEFAGMNGLCDSLIHDFKINMYRYKMV